MERVELIRILRQVVDRPPASYEAANELEGSLRSIDPAIPEIEEFLVALASYEPTDIPSAHMCGFAGLRSEARVALHDLDKRTTSACTTFHSLTAHSCRSARLSRGSTEHRRRVGATRYDTSHVDIYRSARKHGVADADILHAVDHTLGAAEQDDGKVLYLGADRAGNMLEVIAIERDDGTEIIDDTRAVHMHRLYEPLLRDIEGPMTENNTHGRTKAGVELTDEVLDELAERPKPASTSPSCDDVPDAP